MALKMQTSLTIKKQTQFKLPTGILGADLSADATQLVAACLDGVYLVDLGKTKSKKIGEHDSYASSASFLREGNAVVTAGYDGALQWFDLKSEQSTNKVPLHKFWSWDMAVSPDESLIASVTGQYLAGGYKYEPAPESEPSVKIVSAESGEVVQSLPHVPSVQSVTFSPDSKLVAAGNLMGEIRIWDVQSGEMVSTWTTPDFTSWGIIKSHCYLGGIFSMCFTPDGKELLLTGMGPMRDPMAGNGRQLWQKWAWSESPPRKVDETHHAESGEGLMESIAVHPTEPIFVMGGRLRGGKWNVGFFDLNDGNLIGSIKTGFRATELMFSPDGTQLIITGSQGQPKKQNEGRYPDFGNVEIHQLEWANAEAAVKQKVES